MDDQTVYAVVYSNYDPAEVASLWATRGLAQDEANRKNENARRTSIKGSDQWLVVPMKIHYEGGTEHGSG